MANVRRVDHIAIAVTDTGSAEEYFAERFGIERVHTEVLTSPNVRLTYLDAGNITIQLVEPLDELSEIAQFVAERGPGLHHLCFGTPDIREHLRDLKDKGVGLIDETPRPGAHGEVAFLQPADTFGVLVELLQPTVAPTGS